MYYFNEGQIFTADLAIASVTVRGIQAGPVRLLVYADVQRT